MILDVPAPPEKQAFTVWAAPGHVEPDEPLYIHDWEALLAQAEKSLASRRAAYPDWIKSGRIDQDAADEDVQAWEWLAAEWRWIVTGEGELPPAASLNRRRVAVETSLQRIDAELRRGNRTHEIYRQAHLAMALAWHLDRTEFGEPQIHLLTRLTRACRADADTRQPERTAA